VKSWMIWRRENLFFVDSTHTLGPAGEASRIVLEFLPRLRTGVMIHFHEHHFPLRLFPKIFDGLEWSLFLSSREHSASRLSDHEP